MVLHRVNNLAQSASQFRQLAPSREHQAVLTSLTFESSTRLQGDHQVELTSIAQSGRASVYETECYWFESNCLKTSSTNSVSRSFITCRPFRRGISRKVLQFQFRQLAPEREHQAGLTSSWFDSKIPRLDG